MCEYRKSFGDNTIVLVNLKQVERDEWTYYIGRENQYYGVSESVFKNPFTVEEYGRETAVRLYELHLFQKLTEDEFYEKFVRLENEVLACWCLPKLCHGEVLCKAFVAFKNNNLETHIEERFNMILANLFGFTEMKEKTRQEVNKSTRFTVSV